MKKIICSILMCLLTTPIAYTQETEFLLHSYDDFEGLNYYESDTSKLNPWFHAAIEYTDSNSLYKKLPGPQPDTLNFHLAYEEKHSSFGNLLVVVSLKQNSYLNQVAVKIDEEITRFSTGLYISEDGYVGHINNYDNAWQFTGAAAFELLTLLVTNRSAIIRVGHITRTLSRFEQGSFLELYELVRHEYE